MAKLAIITLPDPVLRKVSEPVERMDEEVRNAADMLAAMYAAPGVGLAAVQVNVPRRLFVLDIAKERSRRNRSYLINPEIVCARRGHAHARGGVPVDPRRARRDRAAGAVTFATSTARASPRS